MDIPKAFPNLLGCFITEWGFWSSGSVSGLRNLAFSGFGVLVCRACLRFLVSESQGKEYVVEGAWGRCFKRHCSIRIIFYEDVWRIGYARAMTKVHLDRQGLCLRVGGLRAWGYDLAFACSLILSCAYWNSSRGATHWWYLAGGSHGQPELYSVGSGVKCRGVEF